MPELPDILLYLAALRPRLVGRRLDGVRIASPFVLRTVTPSPAAATGRLIVGIHRLGKRVVIALEDDFYLVFHLMIAGRFRWKRRGAPIPGKVGLLALDVHDGTLLLTEAGSQRRASMHVVQGRDALAAHDPGGIDVIAASREVFVEALTRESHTLKRALTDPHLFSGIGNVYSDEILHAARLSPFKLSRSLSAAEQRRLHDATRLVLLRWIDRLQVETGDGFPEKVTAFREGMAVHGRYGKPCPDCGTLVQRVVYAANEANYCPSCQTEGRLLADRSLSRLMHGDWPATLEELEQRKKEAGASEASAAAETSVASEPNAESERGE